MILSLAPVQRTISILILLLILGACKKSSDRPCFKGTGDMISEIRDLGNFNSLQLYDFIDYDLIQDSSNKVVVHCGENLSSFVTTELENGVLTIKDDNSCHWLRSLPVKIKVDVHFTHLSNIRSESAGTIQTLGPITQENIVFDNYHSAATIYLQIDAEEATIRLSAGGPLCEVEGEADHVFLRNSGSGKLIADELITNSAWVDNKDNGEIRTSVNGGPLWYLIDGHGDIYYRGEASEMLEVSRLGEGELIPLD